MYSCYRNRKFCDIFPDVNTFTAAYGASPLKDRISPEKQNILYYLLYARYGNSTIAPADENQFQYMMFSIIFQYGPTWEKELNIQDEVRKLDVGSEALELGNTRIYNGAQNPDVAPTTQNTQELPFISQQTVSKTKRGKIEQYAIILDLLKRDVSEYFLKKFKPLFLTFVEPDYECYSCNDEETLEV